MMVAEEEIVERVIEVLERGLSAIGFQLAFPNGDAVPTHLSHLLQNPCIAFLVAFHLLLPKLSVGLGH